MLTNSDNTAHKRWSILYRGPLSSCNYACEYCPFAKTKNTRAELEDDARRLRRFVDWVDGQRQQPIGILFTPWGEALIRKHYQSAMIRLSHMPQVYRVAAQTNISCRLDWLDDCDKDTLALWCTYHPSEIDRDRFVEISWALRDKGVRHSVGVVGLKEHFADIEALRKALPTDVYMWINAYKRDPHYYTKKERDKLSQFDPLFQWNTRYHESLGATCQAGETAFTVDGDGTARRCHFIPTPIGNVYEDDFIAKLQPTPCSNERCGCHIGYIHMDRLQQYPIYGDGLLERIPSMPLWQQG